MLNIGRFRHPLGFVELLNLLRQPAEPFKPCIAVQAPLIFYPTQHYRMLKLDEAPREVVHEMEIKVASMHEGPEGLPGRG